ncbi:MULTISPECIES: phosphonate ABC transporter, permease protein PhnE [unclassified Yoonia]|uniref:phosphonate ABC transporter, permease protein PhnE n=1 Tax=unclassified Yoonia TaxID=2629118 RepID=UPI002B00002E|nr:MULTISPECIES: phosphonate ABC transporter, permease protein PhnE [unclassified Yoonia]
MTMLSTDGDLREQTVKIFGRKKFVALAVPAVILIYLTYIFISFDVAGLAERARMDNARTLVADSYSYKTHVTRDNRRNELTFAVEGARAGTYADGTSPDWVTPDGNNMVVDLGEGHVVTFLDDTLVTYELPDYPTITLQLVDDVVVTNLPEPAPDWVNASDTRVAITTDAGRLSYTRSKTEIFRYSFGWEMFWFTLASPYHDVGFFQLLTGPQLDASRSNVVGAWQDFWGNGLWRHADVAWALWETVLMAFLGTFGAAIIALPLAFLAAKNFAPVVALRFAVRRVFDFVRGVDGLIWTIILSRAFGPGPLTGALAILVTDTGSFGKSFSEALENVDEKQIEGLESTGARPIQRYRFGVIPQVTPVLLSQILYYFESNTRSATIIGAITGGGIGLFLTQAIQTQNDWEKVTYYIVLILVMVMVMDTLSGWLRRKLIKGDDGGH